MNTASFPPPARASARRKAAGVRVFMNPEELERFWAKVQIAPSGCWNWLAAKSKGYGKFWCHGWLQRAHRVAFQHWVGRIPGALQLDHLCRNRDCVNPTHMEIVSNRENVLRGIGHTAKNARKTHCLRGHEFTAENTYRRGAMRNCRACSRQRHRKKCKQPTFDIRQERRRAREGPPSVTIAARLERGWGMAGGGTFAWMRGSWSNRRLPPRRPGPRFRGEP